jgi:hypothetical protein
VSAIVTQSFFARLDIFYLDKNVPSIFMSLDILTARYFLPRYFVPRYFGLDILTANQTKQCNIVQKWCCHSNRSRIFPGRLGAGEGRWGWLFGAFRMLRGAFRCDELCNL